MGERMIIMPQEIIPEISLPDVMAMMVEVSSHHNVVIIVPSEKATHGWTNVADQILIGDNVSAGVARLKAEHVGLTVLVNRYDGIDLPKEACRLLAIIDLPEAASLIDSGRLGCPWRFRRGLAPPGQADRTGDGPGRPVNR
jgi:hypothetical protein